MASFLQTLIDGVTVGGLYALIALGYTMVYGILKFINFAHSDIFTLGAWIAKLPDPVRSLQLGGRWYAFLWPIFFACLAPPLF